MRSVPFQRIAVLGVGLIGGSIALAIRRAFPKTQVIGIDHPAVLRRARRRAVIDEGRSGLAGGLRGADLVIMAVPADVVLSLLPEVARRAPPSALITDVAGTKGAILRRAAAAGLTPRFVGGHPVAGSERSGVEQADPDLFRGAPWILCPPPGKTVPKAIRSLVTALGAIPVVLDARRHDEAMARLSHLPQLLSVALVNASARGAGRRTRRLAGPAFRQIARLAASPPHVWRPILRSNRGPIGRALSEFIRELEVLRSTLGDGAHGPFLRAARNLRGMTRG